MRIRTIKPEFWTHPVITQLDDVAQLLALALLNYADDEGYFYADPDLVRGSLMPKRKSERIEKALETLSSQSVQYLEIRVHGTHGPIGRVLNFSKHQRVNRATGSALVAYYNSLSNHGGLTEDSLNTHGGLTEDSARERKGREGKGKEQDSCPQADETALLLEIWNLAPSKSRTRSSKKKVFDAWKRIPKNQRPSPIDLITAIKAWSSCEDWTKDDGQFAPGLHLWIKDQKWEDLPEPPKQNQQPQRCL